MKQNTDRDPNLHRFYGVQRANHFDFCVSNVWNKTIFTITGEIFAGSLAMNKCIGYE